MSKNIGTLLISIFFVILAFWAGFNTGKDYKSREVEVTQQGCELNVTGQIEKIGLFGKKNVSIYFNGLSGITGILDDNNNGHFVGTYKNSSASADCSGAQQITCQVTFDGKSSTIQFGK